MGFLFSCIQVERPHKLNNRLKPVGPGSAGIQIQSLIATNAQNSFQVASPGANYIIEKIPGHHSQGFSGIKRSMRIRRFKTRQVQQSFIYNQIGSASCRESVCQYVEITVAAVSLNKTKQSETIY